MVPDGFGLTRQREYQDIIAAGMDEEEKESEFERIRSKGSPENEIAAYVDMTFRLKTEQKLGIEVAPTRKNRQQEVERFLSLGLPASKGCHLHGSHMETKEHFRSATPSSSSATPSSSPSHHAVHPLRLLCVLERHQCRPV
jgi:hypothetical protein